jgi:hypothetical protein
MGWSCNQLFVPLAVRWPQSYTPHILMILSIGNEFLRVLDGINLVVLLFGVTKKDSS